MVGLAVTGAGNWGKNLVRIFASIRGAKLKYICDLNPAVRKALAAQYPGATVTEDYGRVLADPEVQAVVVSVDAPLHHELAKAALMAGKHAYVEKPLTLREDHARELIALADKHGVQLMVGHLLEYHPAVNYMKAMIARGDLGHCLYLYCQRVNLGIVRKTENAWWSLAPHDVSLACYLFDAEPVTVCASGQAYLQKGIEDVVFANLLFPGGRMAHIHVSWLDPHKIRKVTLVGSQRMVVFDDMDATEKIRIYDKGTDVQKTVESYAEAITLRIGDIVIPRIPTQEPLMAECNHFIECVEANKRPRSDGADGLRVVRILEAACQSIAAGGQPVHLA